MATGVTRLLWLLKQRHMTAAEFSNQFDILYNGITSNQAAGLNEYEKSVFLTKAQNELVKNYFDSSSTGNTVKKGFDESAIRQMDFSSLIRTAKGGSLGADKVSTLTKIDPRSTMYTMPDDVFVIVNESLALRKKGSATTTGNGVDGIRQVVPVTYQEYMRLMSKPFKEPLKWQAWRLISNMTDSSHACEIVTTSHDSSVYDTPEYLIRYVKKPKPIILVDLSSSFGEDLSIDGHTASQEDDTEKELYKTAEDSATISNPCELDSSTHEAILQRAVELAKVAWEGDVNQTQLHMTAGQRSE